MFFDDASQIPTIAARTGTSIFALPDDMLVAIPGAIVLQPEEKTVITIEQVRDAIGRLGLKQVQDQFVLIRPAEKMSLGAANAFLKNLEEPGEKIHFVLLTSMPDRILPTIRSRAAIYYLRSEKGIDLDIVAEKEKKDLAKRLIVANPRDLVEVAEKVSKAKLARAYALEIVGLAIEMLEKSYFITGRDVFLRKLPKYLAVYDKIAKNGHIKLQIVAGLC